MDTVLSKTSRIIEKINEVQPVINILLPFEPHLKKELFEKNLQESIRTVSLLLGEFFPSEIVDPLIHQLLILAGRINYFSYAKSIVLLVSPLTEKIIYTDIRLRPTVSIDDSFALRDILVAVEDRAQYLVLAIDSADAVVYLANEQSLKCIKHNSYARHLAHNASGDLNSFVRFVDTGLTFLRQSYPYPVLISGSTAMREKLLQLTENKPHIVGELLLENDMLLDHLFPQELIKYLSFWKDYRQMEIVQEIEMAYVQKRLVCREGDVARAVTNRVGERTLIIDKKYPDIKNAKKMPGEPYYIKGNIDRIVEKVLRGGGNVLFLDGEYLLKYGGIVLL